MTQISEHQKILNLEKNWKITIYMNILTSEIDLYRVEQSEGKKEEWMSVINVYE